jgi:DNA-binding MarR family transcriptional regulator
MTVSPSRTAPGTGSAVEELAAGLTSLLQALQRMRADLARSRSAEGDRECAAHVLLFPLCLEGPLRQAELAELVNADPSTVSRHVARLVEQGLVTRVPDERDGRASRLVVTERGTATADAMRRERAAHLRKVTADWDEADVATLARLLLRLAADLSPSNPPSNPSETSQRTP